LFGVYNREEDNVKLISMRQMAKRQRGVVSRVRGGGELGIRIREMGLVPGATVEIVGRAPLKDPVHIKLYDNNLTLRNNEADHILVDLAGDGEKDQAEVEAHE
jgi:ferrous iron transport protein A